MRVQFESTLDELVDVNLRLLARSKVARSWRSIGMFLTSLIVGGALFALITFLTPEELLSIKLIFSISGALLAAVLYPWSYKKTIKRRLRNYCREQIGAETFVVEIELTPQCVWIRQNGTQIIFEWPNVETIEEAEDSVDIIARNGGLVVVRNRAFESTEPL